MQTASSVKPLTAWIAFAAACKLCVYLRHLLLHLCQHLRHLLLRLSIDLQQFWSDSSHHSGPCPPSPCNCIYPNPCQSKILSLSPSESRTCLCRFWARQAQGLVDSALMDSSTHVFLYWLAVPAKSLPNGYDKMMSALQSML